MPPNLCPFCACISCCQSVARKCLPSSLTKSASPQGGKLCPMHSSEECKIVLYDIDRIGRRACWSPNVWKIRFVLNFKKLDYETHWLELPDIGPTLKGLNIPPNATGTPYTCPAVHIGASGSDNTTIMDSLPIANKLEELHPNPPLHLNAPDLTEVEALMGALIRFFGPIALPMMRGNVFTSASEQYKEKMLVEHFGMDFDQLAKDKGGDGAWAMVQGPLKDMAALLNKHDGPFILGHQGFLQSGQRIGNGEMYRRVVAVDGAFERVFEATKKWAQRDDH